MTPVFLTATASLALIAFFLWVFTRLARADAVPAGLEWWDEFSVERYEPLRRLLRTRDLEFLRSLPGYHAALGRRLRRERARVFSAYLGEMRADFGRLEAVGRAMALSENADPRMMDEMFRLKVRFVRSWWLVRLELLLYRLGVGSVNTAALLDSLGGAAKLCRPAFTAA